MHVSLDGFVAGPNGEMDWINVDQEIFDYVGARISKGDTALYGRKTYEMMESYWPEAGKKSTATTHEINHSKWYNNTYKIVLSRTLNAEYRANTEIIGDNISNRLNEIKHKGSKEILFFGSPTATHSLIELNLIDGYWLFVNPILLGQGIPLFTNIKEKIRLKLSPVTRQFACGVTELNYLVEKH